jgi:hypothetical protein
LPGIPYDIQKIQFYVDYAGILGIGKSRRPEFGLHTITWFWKDHTIAG